MTVQLLWNEDNQLIGVFATKDAAIRWIKMTYPEDKYCYNQWNDTRFDVIVDATGHKFTLFIVGNLVMV